MLEVDERLLSVFDGQLDASMETCSRILRTSYVEIEEKRKLLCATCIFHVPLAFFDVPLAFFYVPLTFLLR